SRLPNRAAAKRVRAQVRVPGNGRREDRWTDRVKNRSVAQYARRGLGTVADRDEGRTPSAHRCVGYSQSLRFLAWKTNELVVVYPQAQRSRASAEGRSRGASVCEERQEFFAGRNRGPYHRAKLLGQSLVRQSPFLSRFREQAATRPQLCTQRVGARPAGRSREDRSTRVWLRSVPGCHRDQAARDESLGPDQDPVCGQCRLDHRVARREAVGARDAG